MNTPQYRRVASDESGVNSPRSTSGTSVVGGRSISDRIADKFVALTWVVVAGLLAYMTDFFPTLLTSHDVNRPLLTIAFVCLGINMVLTLYLIVYLPVVKKLKDSSAWSVYCPKVVPIMTLTGVMCALLLIRGTWPVWGFFAPLILGMETMGFLFSCHFIPWKRSSTGI